MIVWLIFNENKSSVQNCWRGIKADEGVVRWCKGVMYFKSLWRPADIGQCDYYFYHLLILLAYYMALPVDKFSRQQIHDIYDIFSENRL